MKRSVSSLSFFTNSLPRLRRAASWWDRLRRWSPHGRSPNLAWRFQILRNPLVGIPTNSLDCPCRWPRSPCRACDRDAALVNTSGCVQRSARMASRSPEKSEPSSRRLPWKRLFPQGSKTPNGGGGGIVRRRNQCALLWRLISGPRQAMSVDLRSGIHRWYQVQ